MLAEIQLQRNQLRDILQSFKKVVASNEDLEMDLNMISHPDDRIEVYVNKHNYLQVLHEIESAESTRVNVEEPSRFVFSSETLVDLTKNAGDKPITLQFGTERFRFQIGDDWFSSPTEFDLHLFRASEFTDPARPEGFYFVDSVNRESLLQNLQMMESIAPEISIEVGSEAFWIKVNDQVQGDGHVKREIPEREELRGLTHTFAIRPLKYYLEYQDEEEVDMYLSPSGLIKLRNGDTGLRSEVLLAHLKDPLEH